MYAPTTKKPSSFHPTLSCGQFARYFARSFGRGASGEKLEGLFPEHDTVLVDSGRSAFALTLAALDLRGKTLVLPAYVCDALLPVLIAYEIRPIFLDVDEETYQPPLRAYTKDVLDRADAVLLVATYGRKPDRAVVSLLREYRKTIIEDYASRSPFWNDPLDSAARIYSLPKTLPVPGGGLAILPQGTDTPALGPHRLSLSYIKNLLKLLPFAAALIARVRDLLRGARSAASWGGVTKASAFTKTALSQQREDATSAAPPLPYTYCYPMRATDPERVVLALRRAGVSAERIWHNPIVVHPLAMARYGITDTDFPNTKKIASEIVCAPLWHVVDENTYRNYVQKIHAALEK